MTSYKIIFALLGLSLASNCFAQTSGAEFLNNNVSPAAYAMGNSGVVTSWGSQAVDANPANLGLMSRRMEFYTNYQQLSEGVQYGHLAAAIALPSSNFLHIDALGLAVTRQQIGGMDAKDSADNPASSFGAGDMAMGLSASGHFQALRFGLSAKAIQSQIAGYKSNMALAADAGINYNLSQFHGLALGASINNVGQGIRFLDQTDALPTAVNVGAALPVGSAMGVLTVSRNIHEQKTDVGLGMSYGVGPIEFRGGYMAQQGSAANLAARDQSGMAQMMGGLSGGMGIKMGESARLDYAVSQGATELGTNQRLSLTLQWGDKGAQISQAKSRGNTRFVDHSSSFMQQGSQDSIDWHMIQMDGR